MFIAPILDSSAHLVDQHFNEKLSQHVNLVHVSLEYIEAILRLV